MHRVFFYLIIASLGLSLYDIPHERPVPALHQVRTVPQRAKVLGYERSEFGEGWGIGTSGCSTRVETINKSAPGVSTGCTPNAAAFPDPYAPGFISAAPGEGSMLIDAHSPQSFSFFARRGHDIARRGQDLARGDTEISPIEIDHIFPLSAAWDMGAHAWEPEKRVAFANDPRNLVAVSRAANQEKSDQLPSEWMPMKDAHCWYANRLAIVAAAYDLPLPEQDLKLMRSKCLPGVFAAG